MRKQSRLFQASLTLLLIATIGIGHMQPTNAHPYQVISEAEYAAEQAQWREMIKRDPKNPEPYLKLGASMTGEASEGYWCNNRAIAVYREAIAIVPPNAELHFRLGAALIAEPPVRCDDPPLVAEGAFHLRKAIAIASEKASAETLYKAADLLLQGNQTSTIPISDGLYSRGVTDHYLQVQGDRYRHQKMGVYQPWRSMTDLVTIDADTLFDGQNYWKR